MYCDRHIPSIETRPMAVCLWNSNTNLNVVDISNQVHGKVNNFMRIKNLFAYFEKHII